ncbi:MAG: LysR substrate-binding domain-containing protein [Eubacterium ramulus]
MQKARNAELGENGSIVLGVIETQRSENFLPHTLHALREKHPNIKIDIISGNFQELRESLINGAFPYIADT